MCVFKYAFLNDSSKMMIEQLNKSRMYICMVFPQCELEYVLSYRICLSWFFRSRDKHAFQDQDKLDYSAKSKKIIARMRHKWKWSIFKSLFWVYSRNVESTKIILKNQSRISVFYKLFGVFSNLNSVQIYKSSLHLYICKVCHQYVFEYVLSYRFCLSSYDYKMGNHAYFYTQNRIQLDQSADFGAFEYIQSRNSRLRQS